MRGFLSLEFDEHLRFSIYLENSFSNRIEFVLFLLHHFWFEIEPAKEISLIYPNHKVALIIIDRNMHYSLSSHQPVRFRPYVVAHMGVSVCPHVWCVCVCADCEMHFQFQSVMVNAFWIKNKSMLAQRRRSVLVVAFVQSVAATRPPSPIERHHHTTLGRSSIDIQHNIWAGLVLSPPPPPLQPPRKGGIASTIDRSRECIDT